MQELTQQRVRELFDYREDGALIRRKASGPRRAGSVAGSMDSGGHIQVKVNGRLEMAHRVIFLWHHGWLPQEIDHRDNHRSNNRIDNLRAADRVTNQWNASVRVDNTSGHKGVSFCKRENRWIARIQANSRRVYLGCFEDVRDAEQAYRKAAEIYHGDFAKV